MRPSLVTIGNNVDMNDYFTIMTHDFGHKVWLSLYGEFLSSSGAVNIGNNVYFGTNVTILKGGGVGDNCIIGGNTWLTHSVESGKVVYYDK
jgi:acetyltransferase-like isoleucine patch superfamily enzyme